MYLKEDNPAVQEIIKGINECHEASKKEDPEYAKRCEGGARWYSPIKPAYKKVDKEKVVIPDQIAFCARTTYRYKNGELAVPPKLLDEKLQPLNTKGMDEIPHGSIAELLVSLERYSTAMATGIRARLWGAKILKLGEQSGRPIEDYFKPQRWSSASEAAEAFSAFAKPPAAREPEVEYDF